MAAAGRSYGPYEIVEQIGAGGMGEVFKARDQRLDRIVALKTSREQFTDRFAREARAAAALNHPHIATLHDVGPDYLVMEFVEGETLRGPLPLPRALTFARQILDALDAAHRKGIIHCDLKPANIMVAKNGIKLLDFGLAQVRQKLKGGDETATMTMPSDGAIEGTLQYMSPEQLQGKPADARTDIFAFGLVLYEMLTGRRAFGGDNAASVISAIMTAEAPALPEATAGVPAGVERIIRQCLAKDPDERWQSAADVKRGLELVEGAAGVQERAGMSAGAAGKSARATVALLLGALIMFGVMRLNRPAAVEPWNFRPITFSGRANQPVISPDGKQVLFSWNGDRNNQPGLYLQLVSGGNPLRLPVRQMYGRGAWSPDSTQIAMTNENGLWVMPALGGSPRRIAPFPQGGEAYNVAWSPDGKFFVVDGPVAGLERRGLSTISAEGGEFKELNKLTAGNDDSPAISPDGLAVAFVRRTSTYNSAVMVLPLGRDGSKSGDAQPVTTGVWDVRRVDWTADGKDLLFEGSAGSNNPSLWRVPRAGGKPVRLVTPGMISGEPTVARQTGSVVYVAGQYETKIFKMPLNPHGAGDPQALVDAIGDHRDLAVSSDGSRIAFTSNRTGSKEIWTANADGSKQTQLTYFNGPSVGSPRWSPDGRQIAFDGYASGSSDVYVVASDGGKPVRVTTDPGNETRPSWSHDGKWVYYAWHRDGAQPEIWKIPPSGGAPVQVTHHGGDNAIETPDGQWLMVANLPKLLRMRPDCSEETVVNGELPGSNFWNIGGRSVYWFDRRSGDLMRVPFAGGAAETVYRFNDANRPNGGGVTVAVPVDESYAIYRSATRSVNTLMVIEGFR